MRSSSGDVQDTIEAVWRIEAPRLIASLARVVRDVGLAEDFAQQAFVAALETWPSAGMPDRPGAWLMTTAKRKALDHLRRQSMLDGKHGELGQSEQDREARPEVTPHDLVEQKLDDSLHADGVLSEGTASDTDLLRLVFVACHPVLPAQARAALTLRMLGGLTTEEIARAFLIPPSTVQQRIVRAKRTLADMGVPFEVPRGHERVERLSSVLEVIYLIFNEGYAATAGDDWMRPALCNDAMRLARVLAALMPDEPEVHGLSALLELQASRMGARTTPAGEPVLLLDQDRSRWNRMMIQRGLASLGRAEQLLTSTAQPAGTYVLQASIAAVHARAVRAEDTDWPRIAALYTALMAVEPSPVVELNRAVAVGMAFGPAAALPLVDALVEDGALAEYHWLPAARADLLWKLGRVDEARADLERAASLTKNERERALLLARAARPTES